MDESMALQWINSLQELFPDRLFVSISRMGIPNEEKVNQLTIELSTNFKIPIVAVNNPIFIEKDDFLSLDARVCIDQGTMMDDERRAKDYTPEQYFKSSDEMADLFADIPEALSNTIAIAEMCVISDLKTLIMSYQTLKHLKIYPLTSIWSNRQMLV